jgi:hypothetical protein
MTLRVPANALLLAIVTAMAVHESRHTRGASQ